MKIFKKKDGTTSYAKIGITIVFILILGISLIYLL